MREHSLELYAVPRATMTSPAPDNQLRDWLRGRIEHEDSLLGSRTNIFLVVNGLGAVAIGLDGAPPVVVALMLTAVNILWLVCALQSRCAIRAVTILYFQKKSTGEISDPADDAIRGALRWVPRNGYSSDILGLWMPTLVLLGWIAGAIMAVL